MASQQRADAKVEGQPPRGYGRRARLPYSPEPGLPKLRTCSKPLCILSGARNERSRRTLPRGTRSALRPTRHAHLPSDSLLPSDDSVQGKRVPRGKVLRLRYTPLRMTERFASGAQPAFSTHPLKDDKRVEAAREPHGRIILGVLHPLSIVGVLCFLARRDGRMETLGQGINGYPLLPCFQLLSPASLWTLAALTLPLAIHLWRPPPRTVRLGSLRFLEKSAAPVARPALARTRAPGRAVGACWPCSRCCWPDRAWQPATAARAATTGFSSIPTPSPDDRVDPAPERVAADRRCTKRMRLASGLSTGCRTRHQVKRTSPRPISGRCCARRTPNCPPVRRWRCFRRGGWRRCAGRVRRCGIANVEWVQTPDTSASLHAVAVR